MTREEFARRYCESSDMSIAEALHYGLLFVKCGCTASTCRGWQALTRAAAYCDPNVTSAEIEQAVAWAAGYLDGEGCR